MHMLCYKGLTDNFICTSLIFNMMRIRILSLALITLFTNVTFAQSLKVATAANLQSVIKVLGADFNKKTGIIIEPVIGSSGNLVTQIKNGAPFDVFLSADMNFPQDLYANNLTTDKPIVYALGSLIVCSAQNIDIQHWQTLLSINNVAKVAIANPAIAPYGKAAMEALTRLKLTEVVKPKVVTGESISQVNTYVTTSVVSMGFTSQSLIKDAAIKLYWVPVDKSLYAPIEQGMVTLKHATENNAGAAQKFHNYMRSSSAAAILKEYGYLVP